MDFRSPATSSMLVPCVFAVASLLFGPAAVAANNVPPRLSATQSESIRVDGVLDEDAWADADVASDFIQYEPTEGAPASERTEVRISLTPDGLAIGVKMFDSVPGEIRQTLSRRDDEGNGDAFAVLIDSYNNGQTAFLFGVTAAGVQYDALVEGQNQRDASWDAVWTSSVRVGPDGWTAEIVIPYSQLRFSDGAPSWGINFQRVIPARGEESYWAPISREESSAGIVRLFGSLDGLESVRPRPVIQAIPYTLTRAERFESADEPGRASAAYAARFGTDLKIGLSSSLVLDATINPDFGQVEADPAELNLTTFETFFSERRPFFLEGTQIFNADFSRDGGLLYTRRIGAAAPVIGALKLTGRSAGGWSAGALAAVTGDDFSPEEGFTSVRVRRDYADQSFLGAGASAFTSPDARSATAAGDWQIRLGRTDAYKFEGILVGSVREELDTNLSRNGFAMYTGLDQIKGFRSFGSGVRIYSDGFRLNDVGRFQQTDLVRANGALIQLWNRGQPFGPVRRLNSFLFGATQWTYSDRTFRGAEIGLNNSGSLTSFQDLSMRINVDRIGGYDVRETRGGGPVYNLPRVSATFELSSDTRRPFVLEAELGATRDAEGGYSIRPELDANWAAGDRLELSVDASVEVGNNQRAWVANEAFFLSGSDVLVANTTAIPNDVPADGVSALGIGSAGGAALFEGIVPVDGTLQVPGSQGYRTPLFGDRATRSADITARATAIVSPRLSLQLFTQLFAARGKFEGFRILASPDELRELPQYPKRWDFAFSSLNANAVMRWEYRPGSTLFLVWSQSRGADRIEQLLGPAFEPSPFEQSLPDQLSDLWGRFPASVFLVKLNVLLMR